MPGNLLENLFVIPCGSIPPNPAELLDSDKLREILRNLRERFDYIICDSPPVESVVDPSILGGLVDGTVLVLEAGKFEAQFIQCAKEQIEKAGGRVLGLVINKTRRKRRDYYYQHYYAGQTSREHSAAST